MLKYYWFRLKDMWYSWNGQYHDWDWSDGEGETCVKCGDKDWMASRLCKVTDREYAKKTKQK